MNTEASIADEEVAWLQSGASGTKDPNATVTVSIGLDAGHGNRLFTSSAGDRTGEIEVNPALVKARYSWKEISCDDVSTRQMNTVEASIPFTARSGGRP